MTDEQIDRFIANCQVKECIACPLNELEDCLDFSATITHLKEEKYRLEQNLDQCENGYKLELHTTRMLQRRAETQLKELLSALYQKTDSEQGFTLYRKDIVELAKDYEYKEEDLK